MHTLIAIVAALQVAAVTTTDTRVEYTANGSQAAFAFTFPSQSASWVEVYVAGVKQSFGYTVALNANQATTPGGTVTFTSPPASSAAVRIQRTVPLKQESVWAPYSAFKAKAVEGQLDARVMVEQQLDRRIGDAESTHAADRAVQDARDDAQEAALAQGAVGGSDTYVTATGSPAARQQKDRWADLATAKDFGVVGNGVADDTAALNVAGASGKVVRFRGLTCKVTGTITLAAGTVFLAEGPTSTLNFTGSPDGTGRAIRLEGIGAGIEGFSINVTAGVYLSSVALRADRTFARRNTIVHASPAVPANTAVYVIYAAIGAPLNGIRIEDNDVTMTAPYGDGVQANNVPGIQVLRNFIHDFTYTDLDGNGADLPLYHFWGIYVGPQSPHALVAFNRLKNLPGSMIHNSELGTDAPAIVANVGRRVIGNTIDGCGFIGVAVDYATGPIVSGNFIARCDLLLNILGGSGAVVTGNSFEEVVSAAVPMSADKPMASVSSSRDVSFTGNTFGKRGAAITGLDIGGSPNAIVNGNFFGNDRPRQAILAGNTASGAAIANNVITTTTDAAAGWAIFSDANSQLISNNIITSPAVAGNGSIRVAKDDVVVRGNDITGGQTGVFVASAAADRTAITGNTFVGVTGSAIGDSGTGTVKGDNIVAGVAPEVTATLTYDSANVPANSCVQSGNLTVTGVAAATSICNDNPGWTLEAGLNTKVMPTGANQVNLRVCNSTTGAIDPASRTYYVRCWNLAP
jgi:hypothetical protein